MASVHVRSSVNSTAAPLRSSVPAATSKPRPHGVVRTSAKRLPRSGPARSWLTVQVALSRGGERVTLLSAQVERDVLQPQLSRGHEPGAVGRCVPLRAGVGSVP
jgi:hypothetical protein